MTDHSHFYACIMAGGSGERFWPMSRAHAPKQLIKLFGDATLLEQTVRRLDGVVPRKNIFVLTNQAQLKSARAALPMLAASQIVAEPAKRDTAPAAALAAALVRARDPRGVMALLSSDAMIHDGQRCGEQIGAALARAAQTDALLTIAIPPAHPATGFGYLELGREIARGAEGSVVRSVKRFVEKPDAATAKRYVKSGKYFWNAGMFAWSVKAFLAEAERNAPTLAEFIRGFPAKKSADYIANKFPTLEPKISLDFAIMEKARAVETVVAEFDWDDVGLWTALPKHVAADEAGNTAKGQVIVAGASNNIVVSNGRTIALCGVKDLVVVETADAVLVCHRDAVQDIKKLTGRLPQELL
ncbi:MAG: mannose-1-phosphate guanylyltransferase [Verrucomicrobia bacterium]|nr:mannose-1-phosphate guanylyltransferase [Verrucomicrobiota bacterium]